MTAATVLERDPAQRVAAKDSVLFRPRILIVEDDEDVRRGWAIFLSHHGFDILTSGDGASGLEAIATQEPDVVLLDLCLPGMHGLDVLQEVQSRGLPASVIVITASSEPGTEKKAREFGADGVLAKPMGAYHLVPMLREILER